MERAPRIALLIDADNVTLDNVTEVLGRIGARGDVTVKRAYGNWFSPRLKKWEKALQGNGIRPVQQLEYTRGKNATDMAIVIDAISLLHTDRLDAFAVVSSDADFTPLVTHLREHGADVYGYGRRATPAPFKTACTVFEAFSEAAPEEPMAAPKAEGPKKLGPEVVKQLRKAVERAQGKNGWARIQAVRQQLGSVNDFNPKEYGHATLSKLLKAAGPFELRGEGSPAVTVRVTPKK